MRILETCETALPLSLLQHSRITHSFLAYPQGDAVAILGFFPSGTE